MKQTKNIIILALVVVIMLLMGPCQTTKIETNDVIVMDTIHKYHTDTVKIDVPIVQWKIKNIPIPTKDTIKDSIVVNKYNYHMEDSLIKAAFEVKVDGRLKDFQFQYKPKFPKYIIKSDSIFITKQITHIQQTNKFFIGGELTYNQINTDIYPFISLAYKSKRDKVVSYGYDPFNKVHKIGAFTMISFKKKK